MNHRKGVILIIDDDKTAASGLKRLLNGAEHDVLIAPDKNETVGMIDAIGFDAIVLEVDMIFPRKSGHLEELVVV
jgi:DNA-binding response OmpR family regulator